MRYISFMTEEYDNSNFVHRMLMDIQRAQTDHRAVTDNIYAEVKFLRARVFQIDEEDEYWRSGTAALRSEVEALKARLDYLENKIHQ